MSVSKAQEVPINIPGSSTFGIFPKISAEKTYNCFLSEGWMINYAGYKKISDIEPDGEGRGIFNSVRGKFLIVVVNTTVWRLNANLAPIFVGNLGTFEGDVYIDENLVSQICIVDGKSAYIYDYSAVPPFFRVQTLTFPGTGPDALPITPGYVCYHNSFFLFGSSPISVQSSAFWYAFEPFTGTLPDPSATPDLQLNSQFSIQTKPDSALAVERLPGKGNNVLVLGGSVAEVWTQVGGAQNYVRVQSFNIDNGVASIATIASSDEMIVWLGQNENNTPAIIVTDGGSSKKLSTDGIDNVLGAIKFPAQSTAFFYRQNGHLFYQLTFYNPVDNLTLFYDFTTAQFFHASDENLNFYPARQVVLFNEVTYFTSLNDGSLYEMNNDLHTYNYSLVRDSVGAEIPRIRICKAFRKENTDRFRAGQFTFWVQQGDDSYYTTRTNNPEAPRIDMSFSKNGGISFSNVVGRQLNTTANYRNIIRWQRLGQCNEFVVQLRFWSFTGPWVIGPGTVEIY